MSWIRNTGVCIVMDLDPHPESADANPDGSDLLGTKICTILQILICKVDKWSTGF
jgi:hypothetical protein